MLEQIVPTDEELNEMRSFNGDVTRVGKPEKFMLEMAKVRPLPRPARHDNGIVAHWHSLRAWPCL